MGALTTHVLDTSCGTPAAGVVIDLYRLVDEGMHLASAMTDADGRVGRALLEGEDFIPGEYELLFHAGDYFRGRGIELDDPAFLDHVVIRFGIAQSDAHYHVPLLISPFGLYYLTKSRLMNSH